MTDTHCSLISRFLDYQSQSTMRVKARRRKSVAFFITLGACLWRTQR